MLSRVTEPFTPPLLPGIHRLFQSFVLTSSNVEESGPFMSGDNFDFILSVRDFASADLQRLQRKKIGQIVDLAARTSHVYPKITALIALMTDRWSLCTFHGTTCG